jgi:hypothetical protein
MLLHFTALFFGLLSVCDAFQSNFHNSRLMLLKRQSPLAVSSPNGPRRRRRVRKDLTVPPLVDADRLDILPPESLVKESSKVTENVNAVVEINVQDVRDIVSGKSEIDRKSNDVNDDDEWEIVDVDEEEDDDYEYIIVDSSGRKLEPMEQLLADAKSFRMAENERKVDEKNNGEENEGISIPKSVSGIISTIVTVDFFVVIALLIWFLAGIFGQYVLKDETIQIAFNNIFQPVVQPALGVLMIGSAAGALFNKDEEE